MFIYSEVFTGIFVTGLCHEKIYGIVETVCQIFLNCTSIRAITTTVGLKIHSQFVKHFNICMLFILVSPPKYKKWFCVLLPYSITIVPLQTPVPLLEYYSKMQCTESTVYQGVHITFHSLHNSLMNRIQVSLLIIYPASLRIFLIHSESAAILSRDQWLMATVNG